MSTRQPEGGWLATEIDGVMRRTTGPIQDERGSFAELWRASLTGALTDDPMLQANLSRSRAGVLRGMHFHRRQVDLWLMVEGKAVAATTNLRGALAGGQPVSQTTEMGPGDALFIPRLVAHGFLALTDIALVYLVSQEYDGSDEHGFAWDDADAAIAWPKEPAVVSARDRRNPPLREAIEKLRQASSSAVA